MEEVVGFGATDWSPNNNDERMARRDGVDSEIATEELAVLDEVGEFKDPHCPYLGSSIIKRAFLSSAFPLSEVGVVETGKVRITSW